MAEHKAMLWGRFVTTAPVTRGCRGCEFYLRPHGGHCSNKDEEAAGFANCLSSRHIYILAEPDKPTTIGVDLATQPDRTAVTVISQQDNANSSEPPAAARHPHDAVIRAWLDGKTVQAQNGSTGEWRDLPPAPSPIGFYTGMAYRIKPAPEILRYRVGLFDGGGHHYVSTVSHGRPWEDILVKWLDDWREVEVPQ